MQHAVYSHSTVMYYYKHGDDRFWYMNFSHMCAIEYSHNLVKAWETLHAQARKAVASPYFGFSDFALATARA